MLKLFVLFGAFVLSFSQETENNGTFGGTVNGGDLVQMGRQLNKPMLTIIGMALRNLQYPCEWTQWSPCSARELGHYGSRTRTRKCYNDNNDGNTDSAIESDNKLCVGNCPTDYKITTHGYCIKLYKQEATWDDAATQCKNDGGYLINIGTKQKHDDIKEMVEGFGDFPHIGGRRKDVTSPWLYEYGIQNGFQEFAPGQPDNGSSDLCLCLSASSTRLLYDEPCTDREPFLCEII